jgi:DNA-binding beta-propeller fold protein YncE
MTIALYLTGLMMIGMPVAKSETIQTFDLGDIRKEGAVFDINLSKDGRVYVPDLTQNQLIVLDADLKKVLKTLEVPSPHAAVEDSKGNIYVGTHRSGRIKKFDRQYNELANWDQKLYESGEIKAPGALEPALDDSIYVCDWILQRVIQVSSQGELMRVFEDGPIKAKAQFQAHGLAVDMKRQRVYVADRGNDGGNGAIHSFSLEGKYFATWPKPTPDFDPFTVRALTADMFIVPNYTDGAFYMFDSEGKLLEKMDMLGAESGKFNRATSVVANGHGFIYVPELKGDRIQKVDFNAVISRLSGGV